MRRCSLTVPVIMILLSIVEPAVMLADESKAVPPNIVLFVADDHGLDAMGCYGNPVIQTPNLDQLANTGVRFTHAYCTSASCAASRSVILTGQFGHATASYGHVHDYHHFSTFDTVKSLPTLLESHGYVTARIGKYHVAPESVYRFQQVLSADPRSTVAMAEACYDFVQQPKPFFLYFCPDDPHRSDPFQPDPWDAPNLFGNREDGYPGVAPVTYESSKVLVPAFLPDNQRCRDELAEYYQSVSRIDQGLGRLLQQLREVGKIDNTIVIYISDNGIAFPGAKTTCYEPGIHLPCIVNDPRPVHRASQGTISSALVSWVDLTPTILDFAGVKFSASDFHGRTWLPLLKPGANAPTLSDEFPAGWNEVYASHNFHEVTMYYPMRVVREGNWKLIWNIAHRLEYPFAADLWASSTWQSIHRVAGETFGNRKVQDYLFRAEFELYDLATDPDELHNLATEASHAVDLKRMQEKLKQWQLKTHDPWQIIWDNESTMQGPGVRL